jgi:hypothetical protein
MMNLATWKTTPALTKKAAKILQNKDFQQMLEVLREELPTNHVLPSMGADAQAFAYAYGAEVGYRRCIGTLLSMAEVAAPQESIEATFEEPMK